jgi:DNA-binding transcriptional ArsR family regulator
MAKSSLPRQSSAPDLTKAELLSVLRHPTRVHCIGVLTDRVASPKELASELGCDLRHVRYHLKQLEAVDMVELVREDKAAADGRVVEHFYRATKRAWFDRETWENAVGPNGATAAIMGLINEDIGRAIAGGTFDGKHNHISRTPALLDPDSYEELLGLLAGTLDGIFAIKERAANRIDSDTKTIATVVEVIQFDLPRTRSRIP